MKYRNASEIFPDELLREIQKYSSGELVYIPEKEEKKDGAPYPGPGYIMSSAMKRSGAGFMWKSRKCRNWPRSMGCRLRRCGKYYTDEKRCNWWKSML